jgi:hypothetical protein
MELIDWLENTAIANLRSKHENADLIMREANTTLTIILSGIGVTTAYFANQWNINKDIAIISLFVSFYLIVCALCLVRKCLYLKDFPALYNEYKNLNQPSIEFEKLRHQELANIQKRCEDADEIILDRSIWLNRIRISVALSPVFTVAVLAIQQIFLNN